jgi:serine/threonine protein kinase
MDRHAREISELAADFPRLVVKRSQYLIGDSIGKGGAAVVHKAIDRSTQKDVAIKQLMDSHCDGPTLSLYISEIRTMARCHHFFLVPLLGFAVEAPYMIVTEFMPGGSLDTKARVHSGVEAMSGSQQTIIAMGIAHAMAHVHSCGIVHRDLKTGNVLLDKHLFPHVSDFGLAFFSETLHSARTSRVGTVNYMAPEVVKNESHTNKIDVWAFGMILYELYEGVRPFAGLHKQEVFERVTNGGHPEFSLGVPKPLEKLTQQCWALDPEKRPTFDEIYEAFKSGKVAFPDSKPKDIKHFDALIMRDEEKRRPERERIAADAAERKARSLKAAPRSARSKASGKQELSRRFSARTPSLPIGDNLLLDVMSQAEMDLQALRDPWHPAFASTVLTVAKTVEPAGAIAFVQPLTEFLKTEATPTPAIAAILAGVTQLMDRNPLMVAAVAQTHYFYVLPVTCDDFLDLCIRSVIHVFQSGHAALNKYIVGVLSGLIQKRPAQMFIAFQPFVGKFSILGDVLPIADLLLQSKSLVIDLDEGRLLLALVYQLYSKSPSYRSERTVYVLNLFLAFLKSKIPSNVIEAYMGLCYLVPVKSTYNEADFAPILTHLASGVLCNAALTLIARLQEYPVTDELIYLLTKRAEESPLALIVLMQLTENPMSVLIMKWRAHLIAAAKHFPTRVMSLVLILSQNIVNRSVLTVDPTIPALFRALAEAGDREVHRGILRLLGALQINPDFAYGIQDCRLLLVLAEATAADAGLRAAWIELVAKIARVAFIKDFLTCEGFILKLLGTPEFLAPVITVLTVLATHHECAKSFKDSHLPKKLKDMKLQGEDARLATVLISALK